MSAARLSFHLDMSAITNETHLSGAIVRKHTKFFDKEEDVFPVTFVGYIWQLQDTANEEVNGDFLGPQYP